MVSRTTSMIIQENRRCQDQKENIDVVILQWRRVSDMMSRMTNGAVKNGQHEVVIASLDREFQKQVILLSLFATKVSPFFIFLTYN